MSDELDIAYDKTTCIMGSTDITVDQGGSRRFDGDGEGCLAHAARCGSRPAGCCWRWRPHGSACP